MPYALIPRLTSGKSAPGSGGAADDWYRFPEGRQHLLDFAAALDVSETDVPPERIKSTPSPWSRALLFEQALFAPSHPAHDAILGEWRGLLAAVGMSGYLGSKHTLDVSRVAL